MGMTPNRSNGDHWTIDSIREALASKRISARELTADFCRRIEQRNPELNAAARGTAAGCERRPQH